MQPIIVTTLYLLTIFIPLTFTTFTSELFEFPKFIILLSGALVIAASWIIDIIFYKKNSPTRSHLSSPISLSILAILLTQALSTIFSIHPYTSFWGYYSRFHQGLLTTICYTIIYFAATIYLDNKSTLKLIKVSINTAFVISLYAIAQRLGIDKNLWIQDVVNRPFSTLGQPNWLAAYLLPNIFLVLYFAHTKKLSSTLSSLFYLTLFTALLLTKSRSGFVAFSLSYIAYWLLLARQFSFAKIKKSFFLTTVSCTLITALIGSPYTPNLSSLINTGTREHGNTGTFTTGTQLENGGTESGDIRKIVWTGALNLIKKHPILGTGPETFAYTYYWERPLAHNQTSEWDFLYNKAHNEYLNIAATTGVIGLLGYLYFHFALAKASLTTIPKTKKVNQESSDDLRHLYPVLGASIISFAVTNFFGFSVIPVYLMIMLIAALPITITNINFNPPIIHKSYFIIPAILLFYPLRLATTDITYAKGKKLLDSGNPQAALPLLQSASRTRPGQDLYHSTLGETYAQLGSVEEAVAEAKLTKVLNPYHLNFFKSRAKIYLTLATKDNDFNHAAAKELEDALILAPTDPKLAYNLALVYTRLGDNTKAIELIKRSINQKPDYEPPYYALTLLYEQTNQKNLIPELLNRATNNLATYSAQLKEKVEKYPQSSLAK